jgi:hypothetical protein
MWPVYGSVWAVFAVVMTEFGMRECWPVLKLGSVDQ